MNADLIQECGRQIEACLVNGRGLPRDRWKVSIRIARHFARTTRPEQMRALNLLLDELAAELRAHGVSRLQVCRMCGCTWSDGCPGGCAWVDPNVCSNCLPQLAVEATLASPRGGGGSRVTAKPHAEGKSARGVQPARKRDRRTGVPGKAG